MSINSTTTVSSRPIARRGVEIVARLAVMAAAGVAVAGCGMSMPSLTSGIGGGVFGSAPAKTDSKRVNEDQLLVAAKAGDGSAPPTINADAGGCPRFLVAQRDATLTIYEQGRVGDGLAIQHRGEITKTARECLVEPGRVTIKYGFAGRVLLGPKGKTAVVRLPINVVVTDVKRERVAADKVTVDVEVAVDKPIGYFTGSRTVTIAIPEGSRPAEFEMQIGFDRNVPGAG
jgi:hypothetical protein